MKAWTDAEPPESGGPDEPGGAGGEADADLDHAVREAGIDLDPAGPHRHGEVVHEHEHRHPHHPSDEDGDGDGGGRPAVGIVGAGAVGTALGVALSRAGWPIVAVASRDPGRRDRFRALVPGVRAFGEANALLDEVELIILAVPDDVVGAVASSIRMYSGQAMIHTSGLLGAEVLAPSMAAGTRIGAFHPLVGFAETERAVEALAGATIAIEGDEDLASLLAEMAESLGAVPVRLAPGSKAAYHAAAVLAAGGVVALLDAIAELGRVAGLDEVASLAVYGRLVEQTLGNARALGIRAALTGPMTRGDRGTLEAHLATLATHAPDVLPLYLAAAEREIALAEARGTLAPEAVAGLRAALAGALASRV